MNPTAKNIIRVYLWGHLVLMLAVLLHWLPVYFVCYGGVQAVVLLCLLKKAAGPEVTVFRRRTVYLFTLMEGLYTLALLFVWAFAWLDWSFEGLRGTRFNNPEFSPLYYAIIPNLFYFSVALIWGLVYTTKRILHK